MADIKLTADGNLDLTNGVVLITGKEEYFQRILLGWSINLAEFFNHSNYGLPWLESDDNTRKPDVRFFLGDQETSAQFVVRELDRFTESISFVESVESTFGYSPSTRTLTYSPTVITVSGEQIIFPPYILEV